MSMHKIPLTELEREGLNSHRLVVDAPSQLSDCFRLGMKWAKDNASKDGWVSVEASLPELQFESQEDPDEDGYPQFDGMVSQTIEITDGEGFGRGHLRSDGKWICYGAEYDMMIVDPENVTHWAQLRKLPKASSCGE